jgi:hypothetical protein
MMRVVIGQIIPAAAVGLFLGWLVTVAERLMQ